MKLSIKWVAAESGWVLNSAAEHSFELEDAADPAALLAVPLVVKREVAPEGCWEAGLCSLDRVSEASS
jgi:hypothetical protein